MAVNTVRKEIRFDEQSIEIIEYLKKFYDMKTDAEVLRRALLFFYEKTISDEKKVEVEISDEKLDYIFNRFEKRSYATGVRLNAREAAIDSQILASMMNSVVVSLRNYFVDPDTGEELIPFNFYHTYEAGDEIFYKSKKAINDKIVKAKQKNDERKK